MQYTITESKFSIKEMFKRIWSKHSYCGSIIQSRIDEVKRLIKQSCCFHFCRLLCYPHKNLKFDYSIVYNWNYIILGWVDFISCCIEFFWTISTTNAKHLCCPAQPNIASMPVTPNELKATSTSLSEEDCHRLANPTILSPKQQKLMSYHEQLYHLPFSILICMASLGIIPWKLSKLRNSVPQCPSWIFGQAHCRPWRVESRKDTEPSLICKPSDNHPGATVSVDHFISAQPGLLPQTTGHLTRAQVWAATIFVDHLSQYCHVHLMCDQSQDSTLEAKKSFERHADTFGVSIKGYHADNGRFSEQKFREEVERCNQQLHLCTVGAHHQNGIVEQAIKDLTLITCTLLLHAKRHWPEMISTMLWPMALKGAENHWTIWVWLLMAQLHFPNPQPVTPRFLSTIFTLWAVPFLF